MSASQAGGKLYTFSSEDDGEESVTLNFSSAEAIEANQPALLLSTTAQDALVFEGVSIVPAEAGIAGGTAFDFVGNYDGTISTMKKTYLSPSLSSTEMLAAQIIASSIKIEGDASIPFGGDDTEGISGEVEKAVLPGPKSREKGWGGRILRVVCGLRSIFLLFFLVNSRKSRTFAAV